MSQRAAFASGVPPDIYGFHPYTGNSTLLSHPLAILYRDWETKWEGIDSQEVGLEAAIL